MQKIFQNRTKLLWLFSLLIFLVIYSCTKTDFLAGESASKENYAEKFFATKIPPTNAIAKVIEKLKHENERTSFVNKLPKNCGLPVWDKLIFPKKVSVSSFGEDESSDNVIIPLTVNGYSISTIIMRKSINDSSYQVKWYTASDLYNVCYAQDKNVKNAESLLALFMYMESSTFGRTDFYNVPKDLFSSISGASQTDSTKHIELKFKEITTDIDTQTQSLIYWSCFYIPSGVCNCNGPCDWRNPCPTMYCTATHCVGIEQDPCPGCGGGGGTGGGGGGGPTGGGGGGCNLPFYFVDPCSTTPADTLTPQQIIQLLHDENEAIKTKRDSVWTVALDSNWEYHFFIKKNVTTFQVLGIKTDRDPNQVNYNRVVLGNSNPDGEYHTHQDANPLERHLHDPEDVLNSSILRKKLYYRNYVDCGDTLYVIVNENLNKIKIFSNTHPIRSAQETTEWKALINAGTNRRSVGISLLLAFLGNSATTGFGLYKSTNSAKTEFIKLN